MPYHCNAGQSARVFFKLVNNVVDNIVCHNSPVLVELINNPAQAGQCCNGYYRLIHTVDRRYTSGASGCSTGTPWRTKDTLTFTGKLVSFANGKSDFELLLVTQDCAGKITTTNVAGTNGFCKKLISIDKIERIDGLLDNCGTTSCTFRVKDSIGKVLFTKDYPQCPTYEVVCDGNCPKGQIECGGKCVPCEDLSGQIRSLTNRARRI